MKPGFIPVRVRTSGKWRNGRRVVTAEVAAQCPVCQMTLREHDVSVLRTNAATRRMRAYISAHMREAHSTAALQRRA